jgi:hypothetical protein
MGCSSSAERYDDEATPSRLSSASENVVSILEELEMELAAMSNKCTKAAAALEAEAAAGTAVPMGLRSELAQLHGNANKLLAQRLDSLIVGELTTGQDEARARRKALVVACEVLIEATEAHIQTIDARKVTAKLAADDASQSAEAASAPDALPGSATGPTVNVI